MRSEWHALQTGYLHSHLSAEVKPRVTAQHAVYCLSALTELCLCFFFFFGLSRMRCVIMTRVSARSAFRYHVVYFCAASHLLPFD